MTSTKEKPPEVNPILKLSIGSAISNPIPDDELLVKEGKKPLYKTMIFIIIDLILTLLVILQYYNFLTDDFSRDIFIFSLHSLCFIGILSSVTILYFMRMYILAQMARFGYIIFGVIYVLVIFILKLKILIGKLSTEEDEIDIDVLDIVFLFVNLLTIIPRIFAFFLSKKYIIKLKKIRDIHLEAEHESFVDKVASRIEKGYNRWSNPNLSFCTDDDNTSENNKKHYFDKKENAINNDNDNDNEDVEFTIENKNKEENNNKDFLFDKKDDRLL